MSGKLRILITGFGPFPGAPYNPTQPLVARLSRLRRPALGEVELSSHIFPVTYKAVDRELPLALPQDARSQVLRYLELLAKWNRTFNLTAIREPRQMVTHHILDALAVLPELPRGALADVGSGAGVPGIPIAIAQPERSVTLNDANQKKVSFLRQAIVGNAGTR